MVIPVPDPGSDGRSGSNGDGWWWMVDGRRSEEVGEATAIANEMVSNDSGAAAANDSKWRWCNAANAASGTAINNNSK